MMAPAHGLGVYRAAFYTVAAVVFMLAIEPGPGGVSVFDWDHALAFFTLAGLLDFSYPAIPFGGLKWTTLIGYGLLIEVVQYLLPSRTFSLFDLLADALGIGIYLASRPALQRVPFLSWRWGK